MASERDTRERYGAGRIKVLDYDPAWVVMFEQ
jgi:hypothetical protein